MCSTMFDTDMNMTWKPPTIPRVSSDIVRVRIRENRIRNAPWNTRPAIMRSPGRSTRLAKCATHSIATMAPSPGAAIIRPRPSGPTCSTSFWKTGSSAWYGMANSRGTMAVAITANTTGSDQT